MNKNVTLFIVKNISCVQFSSCHTSDENFLTSNFFQTTVHAFKLLKYVIFKVYAVNNPSPNSSPTKFFIGKSVACIS